MGGRLRPTSTGTSRRGTEGAPQSNAPGLVFRDPTTGEERWVFSTSLGLFRSLDELPYDIALFHRAR